MFDGSPNYYSEQQYALILEDTLTALSLFKFPVDDPTAFLLGGQPGAGKTALRYVIMNEIGSNIIVVDNDSFKQLHPNFDKIVEQYGKDYVIQVTPFSNRLTEDVVARLSNQRFHLIVEGTLRTTEVPKMTAGLLKKKGYEVNLFIIAVSKELSYLGTLARYEYQYSKDATLARETKKEYHDAVVKGLPNNVSTLYKEAVFKTIKLYSRETDLLYDSGKTPLMNPEKLLAKILNGEVESKNLVNHLKKVMELMEINQHQNSKIYRQLLTKYQHYILLDD